MNDAVKHLFDWCHDQRTEAEKALRLYEDGKMRFLANNVDVTESQKASLRRIIEEMGNLISRIKADHDA